MARHFEVHLFTFQQLPQRKKELFLLLLEIKIGSITTFEEKAQRGRLVKTQPHVARVLKTLLKTMQWDVLQFLSLLHILIHNL